MALRLTEEQYAKLLKNGNREPDIPPATKVEVKPKEVEPEKPGRIIISQELHQARYLIYAAALGRIMCHPLFWILAILCIQIVWPFVIVYAIYRVYKLIKKTPKTPKKLSSKNRL